MSLIGCNIGYFRIRFGIFAHLPFLISTSKSCQDLLFIVYICIGFPWSSRSQILKELDGLDLSSNPVQSSPIQSLPYLIKQEWINSVESLIKELWLEYKGKNPSTELPLLTLHPVLIQPDPKTYTS